MELLFEDNKLMAYKMVRDETTSRIYETSI
ncbi:MAG: hypothetical protein SCABRO_03938 [Candidatus Scalindua brodae]|uniref:Uncharacterized protein n=1 Tax=Candidatus Scalindua brodae TaxID=237368 RepID=A0A0B0EE66_9BACT|nr:MAG: hypothetical protein SCABRO_03938 [Candidatus Scalindua brodae]